jgi:hypothetical protein
MTAQPPPTSGEAREAVDAAPGFLRDQEQQDTIDFRGNGFAAQAALSIEGEDYAAAYLARLHEGVTRPGELAGLLAFLSGEMLSGACRAIEKALQGVRHG